MKILFLFLLIIGRPIKKGDDMAGRGASLGVGEELVFEEFEVPIDAIVLGEHQPRGREGIRARGSVTQLKDSIREVGLLQPILVTRQSGGRFLVVSGERRFVACRDLGHTKIRAVLPSNRTIHALEKRGKTLDELALFENLHRKNLTPVEEAICYQKLLGLLGLTQEGLAERLGLKQPYINERLGLLKLPEAVQELVEEGSLTVSQARELGRLRKLPEAERDEMQVELANKMIVEKVTIRAARKLVAEVLGEKKKRGRDQITRLGTRKALYFLSTLHDKFDEIDLSELDEQDEQDRERLAELRGHLPELIEKLQALQKQVER